MKDKLQSGKRSEMDAVGVEIRVRKARKQEKVVGTVAGHHGGELLQDLGQAVAIPEG